jgi:hypothetical protein
MTRPFALVWVVGLLAVPVTAPGQVMCHPNIFGGQDCEGPEGGSSSRPNIFGGFDTEGPGKGRSSSQPNVFDGEDIRTRDGTVTSERNIFGGQTYRLPDGGRVESVPNIFGGRDFRYPDGRTGGARRTSSGVKIAAESDFARSLREVGMPFAPSTGAARVGMVLPGRERRRRQTWPTT